MVLDDLSDSLKGTLKKIANAAHVDSKLVKVVVRDIQRALLQADINVKLVLELSKKIEKRALQEKPPAGMSNREHVIRIVYDELVKILGDARELPIKKQIIDLNRKEKTDENTANHHDFSNIVHLIRGRPGRCTLRDSLRDL